MAGLIADGAAAGGLGFVLSDHGVVGRIDVGLAAANPHFSIGRHAGGAGRGADGSTRTLRAADRGLGLRKSDSGGERKGGGEKSSLDLCMGTSFSATSSKITIAPRLLHGASVTTNECFQVMFRPNDSVRALFVCGFALATTVMPPLMHACGGGFRFWWRRGRRYRR